MLTAQLREFKPSDKNFIFSAWLRSYQQQFPKDCPKEIFYSRQHAVIEYLLGKSKVLVVSDMIDPDHLFGFMVYENHDDCSILHYLFVKEAFKGLKVGKKLYDTLKEPVFYTHRTGQGIRFLEKTTKVRVFNPWLIFEDFKWEQSSPSPISPKKEPTP